MKVEEILEYLRKNKISSLRKKRKFSDNEVTTISLLPVDDYTELRLITYIDRESHDMLNIFESGSSENINNTDFNIDVQVDGDKSVVNLTRIKMGNQNIKHNILIDFEMNVNYELSICEETNLDLI